MMLGKKPFFGEQIQRLGEIAAAGDVEAGEGAAPRASGVFDDYVARLLRGLSTARDR